MGVMEGGVNRNHGLGQLPLAILGAFRHPAVPLLLPSWVPGVAGLLQLLPVGEDQTGLGVGVGSWRGIHGGDGRAQERGAVGISEAPQTRQNL